MDIKYLQELAELLIEISPFLAIVVSILALIAGPYISGVVSRKQAVAVMREKWIYAFRDALVELTTKLDVLHESSGEEGICGNSKYFSDYQKVRSSLKAHENRIRLMINTDEPLYGELMQCIENTISMVLHGIDDYSEYHALSAKLKIKAQKAIRDEWKKI